jgi:hypothetical protein
MEIDAKPLCINFDVDDCLTFYPGDLVEIEWHSVINTISIGIYLGTSAWRPNDKEMPNRTDVWLFSFSERKKRLDCYWLPFEDIVASRVLSRIAGSVG